MDENTENKEAEGINTTLLQDIKTVFKWGAVLALVVFIMLLIIGYLYERKMQIEKSNGSNGQKVVVVEKKIFGAWENPRQYQK